jgi:superfamily II DNA or RNA helicase
MEYSDDQIQHILNSYKCRREKDKINYEKKKLNPEFLEKNRQRARQHYQLTKEKRKIDYNENKELQKAKSCYHYYKNRDKLETFKEKHPEKYDKLITINYLNDQKPSSSTNISDES